MATLYTPQMINALSPITVVFVFARWRSYVEPTPPSETLAKKIHLYEAVYQPSAPLLSGVLVKIIALSPIVYHHVAALPMQFDAYDPHICGRIIRADTEDGEVVIYSVQNDCTSNPVEQVKLVIAEGAGVLMPPPRHLTSPPRIPRATVTVPVFPFSRESDDANPRSVSSKDHAAKVPSYKARHPLACFGWKG